MDDLVVEGRAEPRPAACVSPRIRRASACVVGESARELLAGSVANSDDVALLEFADHIDDADGQQALEPDLDARSGTGVDDVSGRGAARSARSSTSVPDGSGPWARNKRAHRLAGEDARQRVGLGARGDDHRAAGLGHLAGGRQLAVHAAGAQRAPARRRPGRAPASSIWGTSETGSVRFRVTRVDLDKGRRRRSG